MSESFDTGTIPSAVLDYTLNDSILKGRSLGRKLFIMVQLSPAFILSLAFKVGSIAIICALLKYYSMIYLGIGMVVTFIVAFFTYAGRFIDEAAGSALFYSLTNTTILAKCPLANRKDNYKQMMAVSITWLILHTLTLTMLMIWFGAMDLSGTKFPFHWSDHPFTFHEIPNLFYATTCAVLALGPISILALRRLKRQVKALGGKENNLQQVWGSA